MLRGALRGGRRLLSSPARDTAPAAAASQSRCFASQGGGSPWDRPHPSAIDFDEGTKAATPWVRTVISGVELLRNPKYNKGMAFTDEERDRLYLRGLLPPCVMPQSVQVERVITNLRALKTPLQKYSFLVGLQERNERLFYQVLVENVDELKPIIYAPTVGQACQKYGLLFRRPRGLFISMADRGRVYSILKNWPERDVKLICLTDGERVLGLGDLGIQGMGIAVSKVQCYTAFGGLDPANTLPVCIDAGTDTESLLDDPFYIGLRHKRVRGEPYDELIDEFVMAAQRRFGQTVLFQFEDFGNSNSLRLLNEYRGRANCFNDDIQGTAASMLAGIIAALPIIGGSLSDHTYLFAGAGETGCGMADLLALAISRQQKIPLPEARKRIWLIDSKGLVTRDRAEHLADHKLPWAHQGPAGCTDLLSAVKALKPTCLIGVRRHMLSYATGSCLHSEKGRGLFNQEVVEAMAENNERPLIFALSRPVENTECKPSDVYRWSNGRAVYASGCMQPAVTLDDGRTLAPLNSTSCYIFPGLGLGALMSGAERLRDEVFISAAEALASQVTDEDRAAGSVYPPFSKVREISLHVAKAVAQTVHEQGLATRKPRARDLLQEARSWMYDPSYRVYG